VGREDMSEYIQKGYMRIADIPELAAMTLRRTFKK